LILLGGGLFLIRSSVLEIHNKIEGSHEEHARKARGFWEVITQITILDIIFSLDSVITAVGMAESVWVMITAIVIAVGVMMIFAERVSAFVERHPTVKMLALSFLLLIGVMLVAEGIGTHIEKGYIYFAMAFSLLVEVLNLRAQAKAKRRAPAHA
jgi:predicted tellurium resistance membrane protein TerC